MGLLALSRSELPGYSRTVSASFCDLLTDQPALCVRLRCTILWDSHPPRCFITHDEANAYCNACSILSFYSQEENESPICSLRILISECRSLRSPRAMTIAHIATCSIVVSLLVKHVLCDPKFNVSDRSIPFCSLVHTMAI